MTASAYLSDSLADDIDPLLGGSQVHVISSTPPSIKVGVIIGILVVLAIVFIIMVPPASTDVLEIVPLYLSDGRGYVAVLYTGTARAFSAVFVSHLLHLICSSPFTVHLYFVIMVLDETSEHLSVKATLDRYESCTNLDGETVTIRDSIKGWKLQRQVDINIGHELSHLNDHYRKINKSLQASAAVQYWAFHEVDILRVKHGVDYTWVVKMRPDVLQSTDVWHSLYTVVPLWDFITGRDLVSTDDHFLNHSSALILSHRLRLLVLDVQRLPDKSAAMETASHNESLIASYVVGEFVFTPRASSRVVNVPDCDEWGGNNDQFAAGNSSVMTAYFQRGYFPYFQRLVSSMKKFENTESLLRQSMLAHDIDIVHLPEYCYRVIRSFHGRESPDTHSLHLHPVTRCVPKYNGIACCQPVCAQLNNQASKVARTLSMLTNSSVEAAITIVSYVAQLMFAQYDTTCSHLWSISQIARATNLFMPSETENVQLWSRRNLIPDDSSPLLINDTPILTRRWLASLDHDQEEDLRKGIYSSHLTLVSKLVSALQSSNKECVRPVWEAMVPGTTAYFRYGSVVGRILGNCSDSAVVRFQELDERWYGLKMSSDPRRLEKFRQHEVTGCTA